jgi:glycosyltransferase involved in cell wall biosynthesis
MRKLYIIIPAYNEDKRIGPTLEDYLSFYNPDLTEIIVVINNTIDKTEEIVKHYEQTHMNLSHITTPNGGKGYAIMLGFNEALRRSVNEDDMICFVDADNATDPENLRTMIVNLELDPLTNAGAAIASRYVDGSILEPPQSFKRILASRLFNFVIKIILHLNYKDTQCGCKVIFAKDLKKILPGITSARWSWDIDFLLQLKKQNIRCIECPITWRDKEYSKINFMKAGPKMVLGILRLRIIHSPFKWIVKIYNRLPKWCRIKIE